jgi:4'-phosphopantetheinyl transferase
MDAPGWLSRRQADVPAGEQWLGDRERRVLARLQIDRRRADWRLGRWTAKAALGAWLSVSPTDVEVLAAPDGAPEPWIDDKRLPVSLSLSHRGGRAMAVVADVPQTAGCDLELVEPRSDAFLREWLAPAERSLISCSRERQRPLLANLIWTAKEAAAKVRREGLRLNVRLAVVSVEGADERADAWHPVRVDWEEGAGVTHGWWRAESGWVMVVAGDPPLDRPRLLGC